MVDGNYRDAIIILDNYRRKTIRVHIYTCLFLVYYNTNYVKRI